MLKRLIFPLLIATARAAAPFEQWDRQPATSWHDALAIKTGAFGGRIRGGTSLELITMFRATPGFDCMNPRVGTLVINWLDEAPPTAYRRSLDRSTGIATISFERNGSRITESVFLSKAESLLVIHLLADKPGALNFRISLLRNACRIKDRRELDSKGARVWVLPCESDVEADGGGLMVRGEGEALILMAAGGSEDLDRRFRALAIKHDGLNSFPDPSRIWSGLRQSQERPNEGG